MKKFYAGLLVVLAILGIGLALNAKVTIRQGIDYKVRTLKMPLYLKLIDFYDRHLNYKQLTLEILASAGKKASDETAVLAIFNWTVANIAKQPKELPVIDDHVWHIIVRRYGADDQFQDVFATLCNYAGLNAFFDQLSTEEGRRKPFTFVKLGNKWTVFDVFNGVYFRNAQSAIAGLGDLVSGQWREENVKEHIPEDYYLAYFNSLPLTDFSQLKFSRSRIQSPLRRFVFWLKSKKAN